MHIRDVPSLDDPNLTIQVERIETLPIKTTAEQAQETRLIVKNNDPPPILPDGTNDPAHEKVHYVRYYSNNDVNSDVWVDVEIVDKLKAIIAAEQYQEYHLILRQDELGDPVVDESVAYGPLTVGFCDPALDRADSVEPYRFDPFQNIIQFNDNTGTAFEPFDAVLIRPFTGTGYATGGWAIWDNSEASLAFENGYAYLVGGTIDIGHMQPGDEDIDMRFVDQWGEPKTYDNTGTGALGSGDVRGYTYREWTIGLFSPPPGYPDDLTIPGLPDLNGLWWQQLRDYHPPFGQAVPNQFDFPDYGYEDFLGGIFVAWRDAPGTPGQPDNPIPVIIARMTAIGPSTTDNPAGRY